MTAPWVRVSKLHDGRLARDIVALRPTHIVSLLDPSLPPEKVPTFVAGPKTFQRSFFDVEDETVKGPVRKVVGELLDFLHDWSPDAGEARLLAHCHMGASRSTAAAYLAFAVQAGPGYEVEAFERLLTATNKPWPNRRMVALADEVLGRDGALTGPLDSYRNAFPTRIEAYRRLNAKRGIFR